VYSWESDWIGSKNRLTAVMKATSVPGSIFPSMTWEPP
jgi:hypothetical protein